MLAITNILIYLLYITCLSFGDAQDQQQPEISQLGEHCGGLIRMPKVCAPGLHCVLDKPQDQGGTCVSDNSPKSSAPIRPNSPDDSQKSAPAIAQRGQPCGASTSNSAKCADGLTCDGTGFCVTPAATPTPTTTVLRDGPSENTIIMASGTFKVSPSVKSDPTASKTDTTSTTVSSNSPTSASNASNFNSNNSTTASSVCNVQGSSVLLTISCICLVLYIDYTNFIG